MGEMRGLEGVTSGVWGLSPQWSPEIEPLVRESGAKYGGCAPSGVQGQSPWPEGSRGSKFPQK